MEKIKQYFERHKQQLQILLFMFFSIFAFIAQLLSRLLCDLAFKGLTEPVTIWPFPKQALGSFLAFLISNIIAKALSYIMNRKKTFKANNNALLSVVIYIIMVVVLIVAETVVGTPLQNALYGLFGGTHSGASLMTSTALNSGLYQLCGTLSQLIYSAADFVIVFLMDKFVIMRRNKEDE